MAFTTFGHDRLLRWFSGLAPTLPGTLWVAGFTAVSNLQTGAGTEPSGGGYSRISFTNAGASWLDPVQGTAISGNIPIDLRNEIDFTGGTLTTSQTFTHLGLFDASTAGNCWYCVALAQPVTVPSGQVWRIPAQQLTISLIRN